jgi:hypothetical protein
MNRELKTRPINACRCDERLKTKDEDLCRCDERLKTKDEESTRLDYTGLLGELEHLKIETRLIDEMYVSVTRMGEYVFLPS